jgi:hypothetical protein
MMMNKLIALVLALAIAAPVLADDLIPPVTSQDGEWGPAGTPWRGLPGSTYSQWTYADPCGVYDADWPDSSSFVPHPLKEDPWIDDPCTGSFSGQYWGSDIPDGEPCMPWIPSAYGRDGLVVFAQGSWDFNNFVHEQPAKDIWMQITYWNGGTEPTEFGFGAGYNGMVPGDPCAVPEGHGYEEGPVAEWVGTYGDPMETWDEEGEVWGWSGIWAPLSEWDYGTYGDPMYTWDNSLPHEGELWVDGERVNHQVLGDGWIHDVWAMALPENPDFEWVEGGWFAEGTVLIDQVVIETLCYVPEPATMVLLGLGSLLMIRRKR